MLEKSLGLLFYIRKPKSYTDGLLPIYLRITIDGIPKEISTKNPGTLENGMLKPTGLPAPRQNIGHLMNTWIYCKIKPMRHGSI